MGTLTPGQSTPSGSHEPYETVRSWRELLATAARDLGDRQEARWVVEHAGGTDAAQLLCRLDDAPPALLALEVQALVDRRRSGEPLQKVLGLWGFRGLEVRVDGRALIPRPETEVVVEQALATLDGTRRPIRVADLGTGTGVIALSVAAECPGSWVIATDSSAAALSLARENLARQPAKLRGHVSFVEGDWFAALPRAAVGQLALVVSNPPYLAAAEWLELDLVVRDHDPYGALVAGESGLEAIDVLVGESPRWLRAGGSLVVEIAPHQRSAVLALVAGRGPYEAVEVVDDLAGRPRVLVASLPA
ncbi:MAG: peptide chain release factor N(5)-glutamine methyltransferase [Acidimicrobiales bacterium]